jgi:hypothetical protein
MNKQSIAILLLAILVVLLMAGCFPNQDASLSQEPAGFFKGIWHGWIAPISLVVSFFDTSVRIYEKNNTGWWYDFGFYMAVISGFGSLALSRRQQKSEHL